MDMGRPAQAACYRLKAVYNGASLHISRVDLIRDGFSLLATGIFAQSILYFDRTMAYALDSGRAMDNRGGASFANCALTRLARAGAVRAARHEAVHDAKPRSHSLQYLDIAQSVERKITRRVCQQPPTLDRVPVKYAG